jgi:hypothetical protein
MILARGGSTVVEPGMGEIEKSSHSQVSKSWHTKSFEDYWYQKSHSQKVKKKVKKVKKS